jgi:hypothetical protein
MSGRKARVNDDELENDQLKDMLEDGGSQANDDEQDDDGTTGDEESASTGDDQGAGDEEDKGRQSQESKQRGQGDRDSRRSNDKQQRNAGDQRGNKETQQKGQQAGADLALINKLDKNTQNAVMREAVNFVRGRTQPVFNKLDMDNRKLKESLALHEAAAKDAKEYNLNPQERNLGYRLVAAYKKDPIATVKWLVTDAKKRGHNVDLGGDAGTGIDMKAIQSMISEAMGPIRGEFETAQKSREAQNAANEELTNFYASNPDAQTHEQVINGILQRYPDETLETAWLKVQLHAAKNGLDLRQPFNNQRRQQQQNNNSRPMNLRGGRNQQQQQNGRDENVRFANPNAKWGDIIKESLAEQGIVLN